MKMNKSILMSCAGALVLFSGCVPTSMPERDHQFVVGTNIGFAPYETFDDNGVVVGFDIDVAKRIAHLLGKKLVINDMACDALVVALKQGKIDAIIAGWSITKARLGKIAMVHYHGTPLTSLTLLFWGRVPVGVKTIHDLQKLPNKTVCVQIGTIHDEILQAYTFLDVKQLENIADMVMDIKYGKSIAAVSEPSVAASLQKNNPQLKKLQLPLEPGQQDMGNGIGICKNNMSLIAAVSKAVAQLKADGTISMLEHVWFK